MASYEDAQRCPKCDQPGEEGKREPILGSGGDSAVHIWCRNERCEWFNTPWFVTIKADGTVPDPVDHTNDLKLYQGFEFHDEEAAAIIKNLESLNEISTKPGGEIRNPRG
jgi:hypothetical protein